MHAKKPAPPWPALALLLAACSHHSFDAEPARTSAYSAPTRSPHELTPMTPAPTETTSHRPPLDLRAPQRTETATFALG